MDLRSYVTLLALLVFTTVVHQCDGHNRHAQRLRTRRDQYQYASPSYSNYYTKLREEQLLMEINERLSGILMQLNQQKQQQPIYVPIYMPYYMPYSVPYNKGLDVSHNGNEKQINTQIRTAMTKDETATDGTTIGLSERNNFKSDPFKDTDNERHVFLQNKFNTDSNEQLKCQLALVACCRFQEDAQKQNCFAVYNCSETYNYRGCTKDAIDSAIGTVVNTYRPKRRLT